MIESLTILMWVICGSSAHDCVSYIVTEEYGEMNKTYYNISGIIFYSIWICFNVLRNVSLVPFCVGRLN